MTGKSCDCHRWDPRTDGACTDLGVAPRALDVLLPQSVEAPSLARSALRRWIAAFGCTEGFVEDAALIASEAVTNAVVHARSAPRLFAEVDERRLRIEVHDASRDLPVLRPWKVAVGGQGLRIVAAVADAWGWSMTGTGKHLWTEQTLRCTWSPPMSTSRPTR